MQHKALIAAIKQLNTDLLELNKVLGDVLVSRKAVAEDLEHQVDLARDNCPHTDCNNMACNSCGKTFN